IIYQNLGAFLARSAKNRAFRSNLLAAPKGFPLQSLAPRSGRICRMQIRGQPGRMGEQRICECKFATSPSLAHPGFYQILNRL
ncbi:MAG: hypothetical protein LBK13_05820, partial [Spirochaetales bacterium]|nr:hypothetical protein [Spirochaetales bacterium]